MVNKKIPCGKPLLENHSPQKKEVGRMTHLKETEDTEPEDNSVNSGSEKEVCECGHTKANHKRQWNKYQCWFELDYRKLDNGRFISTGHCSCKKYKPKKEVTGK